jgi:hypothetical protein
LRYLAAMTALKNSHSPQVKLYDDSPHSFLRVDNGATECEASLTGSRPER